MIYIHVILFIETQTLSLVDVRVVLGNVEIFKEISILDGPFFEQH